MMPTDQKARPLSDVEPLLRHRLEVEFLSLGRAAPIARAGLAAARIVALMAAAENTGLPDWLAPMAADLPPDDGQLSRAWDMIGAWGMIGHGEPLAAEDVRVIRTLWPVLGPTEAIMETGGDIRLQVDPQTRLNGYGASHRPRPWAITYASTTASSISERGYAAADATRRATIAAMLRRGDHRPIADQLAAIRKQLGHLYKMASGSAVVLAASGTDTELLALALAHLAAPETPVLNILVAPEETGSGVPMAAQGCHFAIDTASGQPVIRENPVSGFRTDTELASVALRDEAGVIRPIARVEDEIAEKVAAGLTTGKRVILHALDLSKTGLLAPRPALLLALRQHYGDAFDIVVDACQLRLSRVSIRHYLALEASVLITGSKFLTGPPFSGALLLPPGVASRLARGRLPEGLSAYFGREEFPQGCPAAQCLPQTANYGLGLRWIAALAEYGAVLKIPQRKRAAIIAAFGRTVTDAVTATPGARLLEHVLQERGPHERAWERHQTVFSFALRAPFAERWLNPSEARAVYGWLNADLSLALPDAPGSIAARICHIGQPVSLPQFDRALGRMGVLRVACGARLIAGEPSHEGLSPAERLERELADVRTVFDKIRMILDNWDRLVAADPKPHYRSRIL